MMCAQCVVVLVLCLLGSYSFIVDNKITFGNDSIVNLISIFLEHNILFHYDNSSRSYVDSIINKIKFRNCILVANYDTYENDDTAKTSINYIRPIGHKFLHVVMLLNYSAFEKYTASNIFSFEYLDIVLVIRPFDGKTIYNETDFDIFIENVNRAGAFFLLDLSNSNLYSSCYYCGIRAKIWELIANLSTATNEDYLLVKLLVTNIYENQFSNFSEHVFAVGFSTYKPFFWCEYVKKGNKSWIQVGGSEGELLFVLQEKLNIYFDMTEIDLKNIWFSLVEGVRNGTFDWVVGGVKVSTNRTEVLEFTNFINNEPFVLLYSLFLNPWDSWKYLTYPFQYCVWVALFLTALTTSIILYAIVHTIRPKFKKKFLYIQYLQSVLRCLVEQPLPIVRNLTLRWTVMLIFTLWLLVSQIMTNVYKGKITSAFINFKGFELTTLDELLHFNYRFYIHRDDKPIMKEVSRTSNDSDYLKIFEKTKVYKDFCKQILSLHYNKEAIIGQEAMIQYVVKKYCLSKIPTENAENLRLINEALYPCMQAWPMATNTPYLAAFNKMISRLNAAGIIIKWNRDYATSAKTVLKGYEKRSKFYHPRKTKITIKSLRSIFFLWFVGIIASILIFLNELRLGSK